VDVATREAVLSQTFVELADTLVDEFDVIELLTVLTDRCVALLDAGAAGILLADGVGAPHVMAASSEQARLLELFQIQNEEGPCLDCFAHGRPVVNVDLGDTDRWPRFAPEARAAGFRAVQALPMRLREATIGALNVFLDDRVVLTDADLVVGQALADAATIAILHHRQVREHQEVMAQLQGALTSRVVIEQAKGMLAERADVGLDEAFARLRGHARRTDRPLSTVAADLVAGRLPTGEMEELSRPATGAQPA
jgi:hypothetical protein